MPYSSSSDTSDAHSSVEERVQLLRLGEALVVRRSYGTALEELSRLFTGPVSNVAKTNKQLQGLLISWVETAVTAQWSSAYSSKVQGLLAVSERVLPKARVNALRRACKQHQIQLARVKTSTQQRAQSCWATVLPADVLLHVVNQLDLASGICAAAVCSTWRQILLPAPIWEDRLRTVGIPQAGRQYAAFQAFCKAYQAEAAAFLSGRVMIRDAPAWMDMHNSMVAPIPYRAYRSKRHYGKPILLPPAQAVAWVLHGEVFSGDSSSDDEFEGNDMSAVVSALQAVYTRKRDARRSSARFPSAHSILM